MSVEKFNPTVRGEVVPYLQVNRNVVQSIRDPEVLAVWVYLLSLPTDWEVIKNHVQNHFKIGEKKLRGIFSSLRQHRLIEYIQDRKSDGKMGKHEIVVLNGSRFTELFTENTAGAETARAENRPGGKEDLHIKQNTYKTENKKSFCPSDSKSKKNEQKKHSWADGKEPPRAPVESQTTSFDKTKQSNLKKGSKQKMEESMMALPRSIRPKSYKNVPNEPTESAKPSPKTKVHPAIPHRNVSGVQGASIDARGYEGKPSAIRERDGLLAPRSARSYFEKVGLACPKGGGFG